LLNNMKIYTFGKIFIILTIPLVLLTSNTFAENNTIEELHKESAVLVSQERYNDALDVFDQILEIDSENVKALNHKGTVLIKMENFQQGIEYFNKALELQPNDIQILKNKGIALTNLKEYVNAISIYETILEIDPKNKWVEEERNYLLLEVPMQKTETQTKYIIHVIAVVNTPDGSLVSVFENIASDFLPTKLTDEFLDEYFINEGIVLINDKKYEKMKQVISATEEEVWCPEVCGAYHYTHFMRVDMLTDIQLIQYFSSYFPAVTVSKGETITETWTVFRQID